MNKDTGKYFTHSEIDDLLDISQMDEFNNLVGNMRSTSKPGLGKMQGIAEELLPFERYVVLNSSNKDNGIGNNTYRLPVDVMYVRLMNYRGKVVDILDKHEINARLDSTIIFPTTTEPVALLYSQDTGKLIRLYPSTASSVDVYYLIRPPVPDFVFTLNGRQVIYDPINSTQMLWSDRSIDNIIKRACAYAGVNLADANITQYSEQKQQTGL